MSTARIALTTKVLLNKPHLLKPSATFLMCPPRLYDVDYVINPWMAGKSTPPPARAPPRSGKRSTTPCRREPTSNSFAPQPGSPDMVFTANAGLIRHGSVALSSFFHPERQGEEPHFRRWFEHAGYTVLNIPRATPFEGEGDALFTTDGSRLWAGHGPRTARRQPSGPTRRLEHPRRPPPPSSTRASTTSTPASPRSMAACDVLPRRLRHRLPRRASRPSTPPKSASPSRKPTPSASPATSSTSTAP